MCAHVTDRSSFGSEALVSVVTPFYNTGPYIGQCIESVLAQTYRNFEYVILDNCSTDDSAVIAERYARADPRIRFVRNARFLPRLGNFNEALRHISPHSTYCKVVLADDWLFPTCLADMVAVAAAHPSIGIVGAFTLLQTAVYLDGLPYPATFTSGREICRRFLLDGLYVFGSPTTSLIRADLVRARASFYNETSPVCDAEVCFELLEHSDFGFVHQVLSFTRRENESTITPMRTFHLMLLTEMIAVTEYGPTFLSPTELARRKREISARYYEALGESALRLRGATFWRFQTETLATAGIRLAPARVALFGVVALCKLLLNPLDTVTRVLHVVQRRLARRPSTSKAA